MKIWMLLLLLLAPTLHAADLPLLQLHMDGEPREIHPQHDRLGFRVQINRPDGSPVHNAQLHVRLQAPETPWIASTDFPVVEGSILFDSEVTIDRGEFAFTIVPPIRGVYTLTVDVRPIAGDSSFAPIHQVWHTEIHENPAKQRNLSMLLLILISIGSVSGFIIARDHTATRDVYTGFAMLALALPLLIPDRLEAHGDEDHGVRTVEAPKAENNAQGERVELQVLTAQPTVGQLTELSARFTDASGQPAAARFRLHFTQLEHGVEVFTTEGVAQDGIFHWKGQFYDGSDHRVVIEAMPIAQSFQDAQPARAEQTVSVEAIAPPWKSVVKSLGFLLLITAAAMAIGITLGRMATPARM